MGKLGAEIVVFDQTFRTLELDQGSPWVSWPFFPWYDSPMIYIGSSNNLTNTG